MMKEQIINGDVVVINKHLKKMMTGCLVFERVELARAYIWEETFLGSQGHAAYLKGIAEHVYQKYDKGFISKPEKN